MSDTPLTDAQAVYGGYVLKDHPMVTAEFARSLERQLNQIHRREIEAEPLEYGVIANLEDARCAADDARREGLKSKYPAACVVLDMQLARLMAVDIRQVWLTLEGVDRLLQERGFAKDCSIRHNLAIAKSLLNAR